MDALQQQLDDEHLIRQFEEAIEKGGDNPENDLIFNNAAAMLFLAEHEYKKIHAKDILNRPSHVCAREKGCHMILKNVKVYRKTTFMGTHVAHSSEYDEDGNEYSHANAFEQVFGTGANPANYQICFGDDECEHAKTGHYCEYEKEHGIQCHHKAHYQPSNIKVFSNFWVCSDSGNVHACGALCQQYKIVSETEADYVCSLTGVVTSRNIVVDDGYGLRQKLLTNEGATPAAPATIKRKKQGPQVIDQEAYEASLKTWEHDEEMEKNKMIVSRVVNELFFSKKRQMLEADMYLTQYKDAAEEVSKYMRVKKQLHLQQETEQKTVNMIMGLCIFQYKMPTSIYFKNVPMMPSVRKYILNGLAKIDQTFIGNHGVDITCFDPDYMGTRKDYSKINKFIHSAIQTHKRRQMFDNDEDDDEEEEEYDENDIERKYADNTVQRWLNKVDIVKKMFTVATISIWRNMNKNLHDMREFEKMFKFKNIVIPLLYMLRKQFSITENTANSNNLNSMEKIYNPLTDHVDVYDEYHFSEDFAKADKMRVIVIPKVEFALLLPHDNQLHKFDLNSDMTSEAVFDNYFSDLQKKHEQQQKMIRQQKDDSKHKRDQTFVYDPMEQDASPFNAGDKTPTAGRAAKKGKQSAATPVRNSRTAAGANNISIIKKITKMQIKIKWVIKMIANSGRLASMQLRMEDISQDIINNF
jgi:hypothetical protein